MARPSKTALDLSNIVATKDSKWRVDFVRSLPSGQRFRRTTVRSDQAEAIAFRDTARAEYEKLKAGETVVISSGDTLEEWCEYCLTTVMPTMQNRRGRPYAPRTLEVYRSVLKTSVYPYAGTTKLQAFGKTHRINLLSQVLTDANKANVVKTLTVIFSIAEELDKRPANSNPFKGVSQSSRGSGRTTGKKIVTTTVDPQDARKKLVTETAVPDGLIIERVRVLSFGEEAALLAHVRTHPEHSDYLTLILLGLRLGLRIGEAIGLDWSAVDFAANTITIDQQTQREKGKGLVTRDPKSIAGTRVIPMPKSLSDHLRAVKIDSQSPHVVSNGKGLRRDPSRVQNRIKQLTEGAGLGDKVEGRRFVPRPSFHDLRRTCLTRLATGHVAPGVVVTPVPPTTLILISGHEDVETLLSFYTKGDASAVKMAMASMP